MTQYGAIETAVDATRLGAEDYLTKPFHVADLRNRLRGWCVPAKRSARTVCCGNSFGRIPALPA